MHLPLFKALVAVVSASVLGIGVALAPDAGRAHHPHGSRAVSHTSSLEADGLQLLGQLAEGNIKPDRALERSWTDDVTAVAHSLGLSDSALVQQVNARRSLAQIAASRGERTSTPVTMLLSHFRDDLHQAEHDQAVSPAAASALLNALGTPLGNS